MKYTIEQRELIKKSFTAKDREKMNASFTDARQIYNGHRRVSPLRARKISEVIGKKSIIKILIPEIDVKASA